jgi:hypothetical protein
MSENVGNMHRGWLRAAMLSEKRGLAIGDVAGTTVDYANDVITVMTLVSASS